MGRSAWAVAAALLAIAASSRADEVIGAITAIVGQRVTVKDTAGKLVTLTLPQAKDWKVGDNVKIVYAPVGDARLASQVTRQSN